MPHSRSTGRSLFSDTHRRFGFLLAADLGVAREGESLAVAIRADNSAPPITC